MKKAIKAVLIVFLVLIVAIVALALLTPGDSAGNDETTTISNISSEEDTTNETSVLYEDEFVNVSYIRLFEEASVQGCSYLQLLIENKTDKTVWISMDEASANDMMVNTGSAVPMVINPGKSNQQPFILFTGAAGFETIENITDVSFKLKVYDNNTTTLLNETAEIKISVVE